MGLQTMLIGCVVKLGGSLIGKLAAKSDNHIDDNIAEFVSKVGDCMVDPKKALELSKVVTEGKKAVKKAKDIVEK